VTGLAFAAAVAAVSVLAGATASVVGFGIGSLLTPLLAVRYGTDAAIIVVALPHFAGSALRGWRLRRAVDRALLLRFGVLSAAGGLTGALLFARLGSSMLTPILGALLLMTAGAGLTGWAERWRPRGALVWLLGALSGFFGGVVGNQGGLRAAALSAFGLTPPAFIATSTVIGVAIDLARTPVYLVRGWSTAAGLSGPIVVAAAGVIAGTLLGERVMFGLSRRRFRALVSLAVGALGIWFLARGL